MSCGCTGKAARGRKLCDEAARLQAGMRAAHAAEKEIREAHGSPAHPAAQQAMRERLRWKEAFYGHLNEVEAKGTLANARKVVA